MPAAICIIPILSIYVSVKPSELSNVTPLQRSKFSIKSLKRDSVGGYTWRTGTKRFRVIAAN